MFKKSDGVGFRNGHLETVKWLHKNRSEGCTTSAIDYAAENGHLETVKWLHKNRSEGCSYYALNQASQNGKSEMLKWLYINKPIFALGESNYNECRDLEAVKRLIENGFGNYSEIKCALVEGSWSHEIEMYFEYILSCNTIS